MQPSSIVILQGYSCLFNMPSVLSSGAEMWNTVVDYSLVTSAIIFKNSLDPSKLSRQRNDNVLQDFLVLDVKVIYIGS